MREKVSANGGSAVEAQTDVPLDPFVPARPDRQGRPGTTRVVIAIADLGLHQEVLDFLGRHPKLEVVAGMADPAVFPVTWAAGKDSKRSADGSPPTDVVVACPEFTSRLGRAVVDAGAALAIVVQEMTVPVLREAVEAGASGVFSWPEERDELVQVLATSRPSEGARPTRRGRVIAVYGSRGGAGTTFLATHITAALADSGVTAVLVDLAAGLDDVRAALGIRPAEDVRSVADLAPVAEEISPEHVEDALYRHPRGFAALLGPPEGDQILPAGLSTASIALLAGAYGAVILHVPRTLDRAARAAMEVSDRVILVVTLDLFSLYGAKRSLITLGLDPASERCRVVVNSPGRGALSARDVHRVLGVRPALTIRFDPAVPRMQDRGDLLSAHSRRAGRDVRKLSALVMAGSDPERPRGG